MKARTRLDRDSLRGFRVLGFFIAAVSLFALPSVAHADQAERLIEQGVTLRVQGKLEEALDVFKRAHALAPSARTLAQMGLAEGSLHRWIAAEDHLSAALASHDTPWIEVPRNREALEQALATVRSHIGTVKVVGAPGAHVTADDRDLGPLPLASPLRLSEGPVHLKATAPGYGTTEVAVTIVGGGEQTVVLPLVALPSRAPPATPVHLEEPAPPARWKTWTGVSLLGASAAAIATGAVSVMLDGHSSCPVTAMPCKFVYDTKLQGWLTIGTGAAAGAAGGFLVWSGRHPAALAAGPGSLALSGRF